MLTFPSKTKTTLQVQPGSELIALELAKMQAQAKHPGCVVVILEVRRQ